MTNRRFAVVKMLLRTKPWDLFWMVEMGHDRIHHGFWQYMDPTHHRHVPGNEFENAIRDYYIHTDKLIGEVLDLLDLDTTAVLMVSDHGAKCMTGGFCFNQWLMREGYLVLKQPVSEFTKFSLDSVDWPKTRVWGEGGYYGRCFINVKGREPQGVIDPTEYERFRDELVEKLQALVDHEGEHMGTMAYKPQDIYQTVN
ncbi:MAG: alkaline phosphatase family protein, partial [Chloroflexi bacterium]|nr:alkaline phosphatase family protein [Chloroflexota bacterium]